MAVTAKPAPRTHSPPLRLSHFQIFRLSSLWFGLQVFWVTQQLILLDERVKHFVPLEHVGSYLGLIRATGAVVVLAVQLSVGFLSDHTVHPLGRRRPWIIYGTLSGILAIACFILAPSYWWLLGAYLLIELTVNAASVAFQALLPDLVPPSQHDEAGKQMGLNYLAGALLGVLIFAAMGFAMPGQANVLGDLKPAGYVPVLLPAYVVLLLGTMLIVVLGVDEQRWRQHAAEQLHGKLRELHPLPGIVARYVQTSRTFVGELVRFYSGMRLQDNRDLFWLAVSRCAFHLGYATFVAFLFYYAGVNLKGADWLMGLGMSQAGAEKLAANGMVVACVLILSFLVGGFLGNVLSVPLARRLGRKWVIAVGIACAGLVFIPLILTSSVWLALAAGVVVGVGWGAFIASDWAFACALMPKQQAGAFMGLWDATTLLPQIFAPIIAGPLRDAILRANEARLGQQPAEALAYQWVFALVIVYFAAGLLLLRPLREERAAA